MPKSKRDQKVSLTKTAKKGFSKRQALAEEIKKSAEKYSCVFTFTVQNMRNEKLKKLREEWRPSRFYFGKNKVMAYGLGKSSSEEVRKNMHLLTRHLKGQCGLLFTDTPKHEVVEWFKNYHEPGPARSGDVATETVILEKGPCSQFASSQVEMLRKCGLPITLDRGVVTLLNEYTVCKQGDVLTPEQCRILDILDILMSEFKVHLKCVWTSDGKFRILNRGKITSAPQETQAEVNEPEEVEMEAESPGSDDENGNNNECDD